MSKMGRGLLEVYLLSSEELLYLDFKVFQKITENEHHVSLRKLAMLNSRELIILMCSYLVNITFQY
jgi:hypothetical protein